MNRQSPPGEQAALRTGYGSLIKPITPRQPVQPSPRATLDRMISGAVRDPRAGGVR